MKYIKIGTIEKPVSRISLGTWAIGGGPAWGQDPEKQAEAERSSIETICSCPKAGINMLTQYTALQYGKENIRCNCVRPGLIVTPDNEARVPQALKEIFMSNIMVNRYGCPEDIGHLCVYLASDESSYVTGQIFNVDGGMNAHIPTVAQFRHMNSRTW